MMPSIPRFCNIVYVILCLCDYTLATSTPPITLPPQTVAETGAVETTYASIPGITANSQTTTIINGTSTILPIWYCGGSSQTVPVCASCPPTATSITSISADSSCTEGFNALILIPLVVVAGAFLVPPIGLPTLEVGDGGEVPETYTPPGSQTTSGISSTSQPSTTYTSYTSSSYSSLPVSCELPVYSAQAFASPLITTGPSPPTIGLPPSQAPINLSQDPLPVLPLTAAVIMNPTNPEQRLATPSVTAALWCQDKPPFYGVGHDPYYPDGFYQYGDTFSRIDGLNAIKQFCADMDSANAVLGPPGAYPTGDSSAKAQLSLLKEYPGGAPGNNIVVRAQYDIDNRFPGFNCSNSILVFKEHATDCLTFFGQDVDYCDISTTRSSSDETWKQGGTFYKDCAFFDVFLAPAGGPPSSTIPLSYFSSQYAPVWNPTGFNWAQTTLWEQPAPTITTAAPPAQTSVCQPSNGPVYNVNEAYQDIQKFCAWLNKNKVKLDPNGVVGVDMMELDPDDMASSDTPQYLLDFSIFLDIDGSFEGQSTGCTKENAPTIDFSEYSTLEQTCTWVVDVFAEQHFCHSGDEVNYNFYGGSYWRSCAKYSMYPIRVSRAQMAAAKNHAHEEQTFPKVQPGLAPWPHRPWNSSLHHILNGTNSHRVSLRPVLGQNFSHTHELMDSGRPGFTAGSDHNGQINLTNSLSRLNSYKPTLVKMLSHSPYPKFELEHGRSRNQSSHHASNHTSNHTHSTQQHRQQRQTRQQDSSSATSLSQLYPRPSIL